MLMVNWREDAEFIYVLSMLVSSIIVFFTLYDSNGLEFAAMIVAAIVMIGVAVGFAVFESEFAMVRWERLEQNPSGK